MSTQALAPLEYCGIRHTDATASPRPVAVCDPTSADAFRLVVIDHFSRDSTGYGRQWLNIDLNTSPLLGGDLLHSAQLRAFMAEATTAPKWIAFHLLHHGHPIARPESSSPTLAQAAVEEIKLLSNFTNELIAPLAGVSRRSLQTWIAGQPISQPKLQRLLALRVTMRAIDAGDPDVTYRRLMDQAPGYVRIYDLLASGRFEAALDVALGRRRIPQPGSDDTKSEDLVAQLSRLEDRVEIAEAPSTGRFAGRLRR